MIETVKQGPYNVYTNAVNTQSASNTLNNTSNNTESTVSDFNIEDVLRQISGYTYSDEEIKAVDPHLVEGLKQKFNIVEEDICKLKASGFDLEQLYVEDYSGYTFSNKGKKEGNSLSEEEEERLKEKLDTIKNGSDSMYLAALISQKDVTINSLYESNFKGAYKKSNRVFKETEVADVLKMNGLEENQQNTWAAKMLLSHGMEVDVQSVKRLDNIQTAIDSLDAFVEKQKELEVLDEKAIEDRLLLKNGQVSYSEQDITDLKEVLGKVTDQDINEILEEDKITNIKNLKEVMYKNTKQALGEDKKGLPEELAGERLEEIEVIKEQINQIRAKLTTEAAQKISEKMPIESMQLSQVVQEINLLENQKIEESLKGVELEVTTENKEIIRNVMDTKGLMIQRRDITLEIEVANEEAVTLEQMKEALASYGANESIPEARFGENLNSVEEQIEEVLKLQGIEVNEDTIMAAKALIANNLEINTEQMKNVLQTTLKVNTFLEEITPMAVAKLVKEGINPYKSTVDQLLSWMSNEKIATLKGSVAESIVALEEKGQINAMQKESMIGLYRIMQAVEDNQEEVVGYLYKNELPLTIEHLWEATKYINKKGKNNYVEVAVDDHLGEVVSRSEGKTAKSMLEKSNIEIAKNIEVTRLVEEMPLELETDTESKLRKINAFLYPFIKEQFKAQIGKFEGMSTLPQSFLEKLEYIKTIHPEVINTMAQGNIPLTISNIYWFGKINENPALYAQVLERNQMLKEDLPDRIEEIEMQLEEIEAKARSEKEIAVTTGDISKYRDVKVMEEVVQMQKQIIKQEGIYHIPLLINGEQRLIKLQLQKDDASTKENNEKSLKAIISYEAQYLGKVKAYIEIKDDILNYKVQGENDGATRILETHNKNLKQLIEVIGYRVDRSVFEAEEGVQGDTLLKMSKKGESLFEEII